MRLRRELVLNNLTWIQFDYGFFLLSQIFYVAVGQSLQERAYNIRKFRLPVMVKFSVSAFYNSFLIFSATTSNAVLKYINIQNRTTLQMTTFAFTYV